MDMKIDIRRQMLVCQSSCTQQTVHKMTIEDISTEIQIFELYKDYECLKILDGYSRTFRKMQKTEFIRVSKR